MSLPQTLTLDSAAGAFDTLLADAAAARGALYIDASALPAFDTSAIALLLQARRLAQAWRPSGHRRAGQAGAAARLYGVETCSLRVAASRDRSRVALAAAGSS